MNSLKDLQQFDTNTEEKQERRTVLFFIFIGSLLAIWIGSLLYSRLLSISESDDSSEEYTAFINEETSSSTLYDPIGLVTYFEGKEIFIYDVENDSKLSALQVEEQATLYEVSWKNRAEITYSSCSSRACSLKTYNKTTKEISLDFELEADSISTFRWSHDQQTLAVMYTKEGKKIISIIKENTGNDIFTYIQHEQEPQDFNDALYLRFSPDDQYVLSVNTYVDRDDSSIMIFDTSGTVQQFIKGEEETTPTYAVFADNETIYYKYKTKIYKRSLIDGSEEILTERINDPYDITIDPDGTTLAYWSYDYHGGITIFWTYNIKLDTLSRVTDNASHPMWIDSNTLAILKNEICSTCPYSELTPNAISIIDLSLKQITTSQEIGIIESPTSSNY